MYASIFIPTGNRNESLKNVLKSLLKQSFKDFEVIVVDAKFCSKTLEIINNFKRLKITYFKQKSKGLVEAANLALKKAKGEIFVRIDDDVILSAKWLEEIYITFTDKTVGAVTGPTIIPRKNLNNRDLLSFINRFKQGSLFWQLLGKVYLNFILEKKHHVVCRWFRSGAFSLGSNFESARKVKLQEVDNLEACNFSVRTSLLRKINGFDIYYGGVGDYHESDAAQKIKALGYKLIFNPKAYLYHCPSPTINNERSNSYIRMSNFIYFYLKHIKLDSFDKAIRFSTYILFQDLYYIYQSIKTKDLNQLGALLASLKLVNLALTKRWYHIHTIVQMW